MPDSTMTDTPLVEHERNAALPPTWAVIQCQQGCLETWTVDAADFDPPLTIGEIEAALTPELLAHERDHHRGDRLGDKALCSRPNCGKPPSEHDHGVFCP